MSQENKHPAEQHNRGEAKQTDENTIKRMHRRTGNANDRTKQTQNRERDIRPPEGFDNLDWQRLFHFRNSLPKIRE